MTCESIEFSNYMLDFFFLGSRHFSIAGEGRDNVVKRVNVFLPFLCTRCISGIVFFKYFLLLEDRAESHVFQRFWFLVVTENGPQGTQGTGFRCRKIQHFLWLQCFNTFVYCIFILRFKFKKRFFLINFRTRVTLSILNFGWSWMIWLVQ